MIRGAAMRAEWPALRGWNKVGQGPRVPGSAGSTGRQLCGEVTVVLALGGGGGMNASLDEAGGLGKVGGQAL